MKYLKHINEFVGTNEPIIVKTGTFKTEEGNFSYYGYDNTDRKTNKMFTVYEDKNGWIIRNAYVPENIQRKGIASKFYKQMNILSKHKTGNPIKSTQPRILSDGTIVHELSDDAIALWEYFVKKGIAKKIADKNYQFN
jgi:predicted GNAT family acetyltransferase